ncbi:glycosyltransferase [Sphingomonas sp. ABOLG]|uniref:glycosyltransferase n=1 Tax=Sphingomonas sp. ABOLG TaxID=1985880 RepID=UPI000F7F8BAA|nr:glycosyltransferase [Sphingomonas sp. ABOLG]RSV18178.1 glycosyltransferase [Sphingomonas sp. ABOLG]
MSSAEHILSYAQTLRGGGVERALLRLAGEWIALGRRVTLVIGSKEGPLARELPGGADVLLLDSPAYRALLSLPRHVRATRPDVIFCPGSHYTGVAAWTRWRLGAATPPIVGKVSNALARPDHGAVTGLAHALWLRQHPRFLDRVVAMTPASAAETAAAMRLTPSSVPIIPNPPARPIAGAPQLNLPPRYVLGVGRLAPQKRWDQLVSAIAAMRERVPLVILGEGEGRDALMAQARALGVDLILPGHVADPLPAMAGAALLALTSDFEGSPGVLREALSMGAPVVSTDSSPAVAEIIADPAWGAVVPREDPAALVAALDHWMVAPRPAPVTPPGSDSAARYLALFDSLMPA